MPTPLSWTLAESPTPAAHAVATGVSSRAGDVDYGEDFSTYPDLDWSRKISGPTAVLEAVARSLEDAQEGIDLRDWLNSDLGPAELYNLEESIKSRCLSDERVQNATVEVSQPSLFELVISISLPLAEGPFRRVLKVTELGLQILSEA
jgi:hypothetical protein